MKHNKFSLRSAKSQYSVALRTKEFFLGGVLALAFFGMGSHAVVAN